MEEKTDSSERGCGQIVCVCVRTHVRLHVYVLYTYVYMYVWAYVHACKHVCECSRTPMCVRVNVCMCAHVSICTCMCASVCMYVCAWWAVMLAQALDPAGQLPGPKARSRAHCPLSLGFCRCQNGKRASDSQGSRGPPGRLREKHYVNYKALSCLLSPRGQEHGPWSQTESG